MSAAKQRLDHALVDRGLAESRQKAQAYIMAGQVLVDDRPVTKAGALVPGDAAIRLKGVDSDVARSAKKLRQAVAAFGLSVEGRTCLDVGASTGGFTQVLLEHDAARVIAVDVGAGLIHESLRQDPRVTLMERTNARHLSPSPTLAPVTLAVMDLSFISLKLVLPAVFPACPALEEVVALVKPQFEVGRDNVGSGGIVRDEKAVMAVLDDLKTFAQEHGWVTQHQTPCDLKGAKGNQEWLWHLVHPPMKKPNGPLVIPNPPAGG